MSNSSEHFAEHSMDRDWPLYMDIFTGPTSVKTQLEKMAKNSSRLSPELIADMIGRDVSDQYIYARDHTNTLGMKFVLNSTTGLANIFANNVMRIAGFAASIWVDVAVFGGAAVGLFGSHMNAFGVGAAIFATWLGMTHDKPLKDRILPYLCLGIASAGASLILVSQTPQGPNAPDFRKPFTELLATQFTRGNTDERVNIANYQGQIDGKLNQIHMNEVKLAGNGTPMLNDGYQDNDDIAREMERQNVTLRAEVASLTASKAKEEANLVTATQQDPVDFWGRIFAALYIGTWLFSSQALVAGIIGQVRANHKERSPHDKAEAKKNKHLKDFRKFIEAADDGKRRNFMHNAVVSVATQFANILYEVAPENSDPVKHDKFASLFEGDNRTRIHEMAFRYVDNVVEPRAANANEKKPWSVFNRKSGAAPQPEAPAPAPSAEASASPAAEPAVETAEPTPQTGPSAPKP